MIVVAETKRALYWGCYDRIGHYLHTPDGGKIYNIKRVIASFPWDEALMDTGLLKNGNRPDVYDGKVFWTCGGTPLWLAMFLYDRSVDHRGASNSGFYVQGFDHHHVAEALEYAKEIFPNVTSRQKYPLILQNAPISS